jgi:predicted transcriptional regulator
MRVKDVATRALVWTSPEECIRQAARQLGANQIGALTVGAGGRPVGVLTEWDIVQAVADGVDLNETCVGEYMTPVVLGIEEDVAVSDAVAQMKEYRVRHLVVLRQGKPRAMLSDRDLLEGTR